MEETIADCRANDETAFLLDLVTIPPHQKIPSSIKLIINFLHGSTNSISTYGIVLSNFFFPAEAWFWNCVQAYVLQKKGNLLDLIDPDLNMTGYPIENSITVAEIGHAMH